MLHTQIFKNNYAIKVEFSAVYHFLKEIPIKIPKFLDATETSCCFTCFKALLKMLTSYFAPVKSN